MMTDNDDITQPVQTGDQESLPKTKRKIGGWIWLGVGLVLIVTVIGGLLGYSSAVQARLQQEANQRALLTTTQYQLGIIDAEAGRFDIVQLQRQ